MLWHLYFKHMLEALLLADVACTAHVRVFLDVSQLVCALTQLTRPKVPLTAASEADVPRYFASSQAAGRAA